MNRLCSCTPTERNGTSSNPFSGPPTVPFMTPEEFIPPVCRGRVRKPRLPSRIPMVWLCSPHEGRNPRDQGQKIRDIMTRIPWRGRASKMCACGKCNLHSNSLTEAKHRLLRLAPHQDDQLWLLPLSLALRYFSFPPLIRSVCF